MKITCFGDIVTEARKTGGKCTVAVAQAHHKNTLRALDMARREGICSAILYGDGRAIEKHLSDIGAPKGSFDVVNTESEEQSVELAVQAIHSDRANALMKGLMDTS
ncbi:MAG: hypothetical protein IJ072_05675, partial [Oscillospiraceae bacterium]|nr:hypothetical protein [Oscillospiraceae bacterium]